jgi:hypothetical protein
MPHSRKNPDWSTINLSKLHAKRIYKLPATYRLQDDPGNGCSGDPPGYPSYFTRSVYTQHGNSPASAPEYVILHAGRIYEAIPRRTHYEKWGEILHALWLPLPVDHPRTVAWMQSTYSHHRHCYRDLDQVIKPSESGGPATIIYPLQRFWFASYGFREFKDDPRFSDEWRSKEKAAIEQHNAELMPKYLAVCVPENHSAVNIIRRYYPDHAPRLDWIETAPPAPGNWWETATEPPAPEDCPGQYSMKHPVNGSWCQWCGWRAEKGGQK